MKSSKSNPGGGIKLNLGSDPNKKAWMKIKPDMTSQQRHISQLAFFLLDRLLGLFVTVPTTGNVFIFELFVITNILCISWLLYTVYLKYKQVDQ